MKQIPPEGFPPGLSQPALRALAGTGYLKIEDLSAISETELKKLHGMGPKAVALLKQALIEKGLSFKAKG